MLWLLHELGQPFETEILDIRKGAQKSPGYLKINPFGKVPSIVDDGVAVTESPAICIYLADKYPAAGLAPAPTAPERGEYLRWHFIYSGCIEPAFMDAFMKRQSPPTAAGWPPFPALLDAVSDALAGKDYLVGNRFSTADVMVGSFLRYSIYDFKAVPERPEYRAYVERLKSRPALRRALAEDERFAQVTERLSKPAS
jgi:glutathione S-transferase